VPDINTFIEQVRTVSDPHPTLQSLDPVEPIVVQLSTVPPEPVRWLWPGWLPEGALAVLDGDPGLGKSTLTLDLAARITRGWVMPPGDGRDYGRPPAGVLLLGAEDSLKHTVRPRLDAAGADAERVYSLEAIQQKDTDRPPELPGDLDLMRSRIVAWGVRLVVVDPLMAFLSEQTNAHKDQDIRRCLRPLSRLAGDLGIVILLLRHLNKLSGGPALYRGGSSIGISGAARASLIVGRDPNADRYVLAMNKCNLGARPPSLAYRLESSGLACRIVWEAEVDLRPDEILGHGPSHAQSTAPGRPDHELQEACQFLADLLCGGPVSSRDVETRAEQEGHTWRTIERAKVRLKVRSRRQGKGWVWELPVLSSPPEESASRDEAGDEIDGGGVGNGVGDWSCDASPFPR
jgi:archaellum biogenesis ATPase FlaH